MKKWILLLAAMMLLNFTAAAEMIMPAMAGMEAKDFEVRTLDGGTFRLSEQRGKVVVVNIWATWCGPCVQEMPDLERISREYGEKVVVIGVNSGESEETIARFVEDNGYTFLFGIDEEYYVGSYVFPTTGIPHTVVIDENGIISEVFTGSRPEMYEYFKVAVDEALNAAKFVNGIEILA